MLADERGKPGDVLIEDQVALGAEPVRPGSEAQTVPRSPAERDAERIRMRLHMAEVQYQQQGGTGEYLQFLADELAQEGTQEPPGLPPNG